MSILALIRHGPTAWNASGRIQGRTDMPLSPAGRTLVGRWRPAPELRGARWFTSPLVRARATAALLHAGPVTVEPCLIEMDWGCWEGLTLAEARAADPAGAAREGLGLHFRPTLGESPAEVQTRLAAWLGVRAGAGEDTVAVSHKGVIRALYALATGWDMKVPARDRLEDGAAHLFALGVDGALSTLRLNVGLVPA